MNDLRHLIRTCIAVAIICFGAWAFQDNPKPKPKTSEPVPFCLDEPDFLAVKNAFDVAAKAQKPADGCIPGQRNVKLDEKTAYNLLFAIAQGLGLPRHEPPNTKPKGPNQPVSWDAQKPVRYGEQNGRWKCETCGDMLWLDEHVGRHHVDSSRDGDHPAKLCQADLKTIADGLRMSD